MRQRLTQRRTAEPEAAGGTFYNDERPVRAHALQSSQSLCMSIFWLCELCTTNTVF